MATSKGSIKAISISDRKGVPKTNVPAAELKTDFGIAGDAHAATPNRQVSLLAAESIDKMLAKGADVQPGSFAENITTIGLDLMTLDIGTKLKLGPDVELEITQIGKECHSRCQIFQLVGDCVMPREGIFAKVLTPGRININDTIEVLK